MRTRLNSIIDFVADFSGVFILPAFAVAGIAGWAVAFR